MQILPNLQVQNLQLPQNSTLRYIQHDMNVEMLLQIRLAPDELYKREYPKSLPVKHKEFRKNMEWRKTVALCFEILHLTQSIPVHEIHEQLIASIIKRYIFNLIY